MIEGFIELSAHTNSPVVVRREAVAYVEPWHGGARVVLTGNGPSLLVSESVEDVRQALQKLPVFGDVKIDVQCGKVVAREFRLDSIPDERGQKESAEDDLSEAPDAAWLRDVAGFWSAPHDQRLVFETPNGNVVFGTKQMVFWLTHCAVATRLCLKTKADVLNQVRYLGGTINLREGA